LRSDFVADRSNADEQILNERQGLPIAQERDKEVDSKFWTTYDKVSTEYDNDFLERANGDMGIILTFVRSFASLNANLTGEPGWFILSCQLHFYHRNAA
jgi:hypothetical protein